MFEESTFETILNRMLDRIPDTMDKREGAIIYDALAPAAVELQLAYIALDTFLKQVFTNTAEREYLIRRVWERGVSPHGANPAVWRGRFEPSTLEISNGARFNAGQFNFAVQGKVEDGVYLLVCEVPGSEGNGCAGQLIPMEYINGLQKAELTELVVPGNDEEETEALRDRYLHILRKPATSGNKYDYYNWAMACDGVGAAKVFPLAYGPGTVKVVITDEDKAAAPEALIRVVKDYIEEQRPIGAEVTVLSAQEVLVDVTAKVRLLKDWNLGTVQQDFRERLESFFHENAFDLSYVGIARVGKLLLETDGIEDYDGLMLQGQEENVPLTDEQIAVAGTVVLEVMI